MNAFAAATRGFVVAAIATLLLASMTVWGPALVAGTDVDAPSSVSPVLRQIDDGEEAGTDVAVDAEAIDGDGPATVGELVDQLAADGATETFDVYLSRDPFQPVVVQLTSTSGDGGTSGDGTSGDGTNGDGTSGDGTSGDGGSSGGNDNGMACSGSGEEAVCEGTVITMTGFTSGGAALVEVDGVLYTVVAGDVFATSFRVERLDESAGCAFLRYGDEAFTICTGATVLK